MPALKTYFSSKFRLSLRATIGVPFVLLYSATVGVLTLLPYNEIRQQTQIENLRLLDAMTQDTQNQLQTYLGGPFQIQRKLASDISDLQLYAADHAHALQKFLQRSVNELSESHRHIAMLGFARQDGSAIDFRRNADGEGFSLSMTGPGTSRIAHYDPRLRPWYAHALESQDAIWTPVDASADAPRLMSLNASTAVRQQQIPTGVFTVNVALDSLSHLLASQPLKGHGVIFITDHEGWLVADSEQAPRYTEPTPPTKRRQAIHSPSGPIRSAAAHLKLAVAPAPSQFTLQIAEERYFGRVTPFHDAHGLRWDIVTMLPESALLGSVLASTRTMLLWVVGLSSLCLILGLLLIEHITRPLRRVAIAAHALARGEMGTLIDGSSRILETHALVSAFNTMSGNLQAAFRDLRDQLSRDHLTKLLSRQGLIDQCAGQPSGCAVLCFVRLNEFRNINEVAGYGTGDLLIQSITQRLRERLPSRALIARIGSDELAILFTQVGEHDAPRDYAQLVQETYTKAFSFGANEIKLSASIGYVSGHLGSNGLEDWMRNASIALREARRRGFNQCVEFSAPMMEQSVSHNRTAMELRHAMERQELFLCYQPIVRLRDRGVIAVEARPRWNHPSRGVLRSEHFVPIAQASDLVLRLEYWIIEQATRQFAIWLPNLPTGVRLHLNISNQQVIQSGFVSHLQHTLRDAHLPGHRLTIEVTDTQLMEQDPGLKRRLRMLRGLGVQLALADFGAGSTSLAHLSQMPFECFKIDMRLIAELTQSKKAAAVVMAILDIGHNFDTRVIANGVCTQAQAERLAELGCEYAQGDYFGAALPAEAGTPYADAVRTSSC